MLEQSQRGVNVHFLVDISTWANRVAHGYWATCESAEGAPDWKGLGLTHLPEYLDHYDGGTLNIEVGEMGVFGVIQKIHRVDGYLQTHEKHTVPEGVTGKGPVDMVMKTCYTEKGEPIGDYHTARLLVKRGIKPEFVEPGRKICSVGFCEKDGKWYGWSHRAMYGFKEGDVSKKGHLPHAGKEFVIRDARKAACDFAASVS